MRDLQQFIESHRNDIGQPVTKPGPEPVRAMLASLEIFNSKDLERYLVTYGRLAYKSVEFLGAGDNKSDMFEATRILRSQFPLLRGYMALERLGDGAYAMCDGHGRVFRFDAGGMKLRDLHAQLEEYILDRFLGEDAE